MFLSPVEEKETIKVVREFTSKTSTDFSDISMNIVKKVFDYIVKPFTNICNKSFSNGVFPDNMEIAKVIPLYKAGVKDVFTNYRPVSLLSQFSKILEKLFTASLLSIKIFVHGISGE